MKKAKEWRVRFKTPDGMFTFTDISHPNGELMTLERAEDWAIKQTLKHPDRFAEVAKIYAVDDEAAAA